MSLYYRRRNTNLVATTLCWGAAAFGLSWLVMILGALVFEGAKGLSLDVFTQNTPPPGSAGGLLNAMAGSLIMTIIGVAVGGPLGMLAGTYMANMAAIQS